MIETLITDKDGHAESGELLIAAFKDGRYEEAVTYTVVEVEAPEGYLLDSTPKEVKFEYKDGKTRVVVYTLEVTNKPTEPKLPQTGDNMNPWVFAGFGLVAVAAGLAVLFWKKRKEGNGAEA